MVKIKLGAIITGMSGKLGGHAIGKNGGQHVLKTKSVANKNPTASQSQKRLQTASLMQLWSTLSDSQRNEWYSQLQFYKYFDQFGDVNSQTSFSLFQKLNQGRLNCGLSALSIPAAVTKPSLPQSINITATTTAITVQSNDYTSGDYIQLYASGKVSRGLSNPAKFMRVIDVQTGDNYASGVDVFNAYVSVFGQPADSDYIFFGLKTISAVSGYSNGKIIVQGPVIVSGVAVDNYIFQDSNQFVFQDGNTYIFN